MGLFDKKELTIDELEEKADRLKVEEEVVTREAVVEERKAIIQQLKSRYGSDWKHLLGLGDQPLNIQTLRSLLAGPKRGLQQASRAFSNERLSPLPGRGMKTIGR